MTIHFSPGKGWWNLKKVKSFVLQLSLEIGPQIPLPLEGRGGNFGVIVTERDRSEPIKDYDTIDDMIADMTSGISWPWREQGAFWARLYAAKTGEK